MAAVSQEKVGRGLVDTQSYPDDMAHPRSTTLLPNYDNLEAVNDLLYPSAGA